MDQTEPQKPRYSTETVPIIDFGPYLAGEPGALERAAKEADEASRSLGFFFIKNHGVAQELIDRMFAETARFHALPLEKKLEVKVTPKENVGYLPQGGQTQLSYSKLYGESKHPDRSISYFVRNEYPADHPDRIAGKPWVSNNRWPNELPGFRETCIEYFKALSLTARRILTLHSTALGMGGDWLVDHDAFSKDPYTLRLLDYPPRDPALDGQWGIGPHTDYGYGAILAQARVPGLEILTIKGEWIQAPALEGHLLFNCGDFAHRWTNGRYRAAPHRVVNYSGVHRNSVVFFTNSRGDVKMDCFPTCKSDNEPPKFPAMSFGEYITELRKTNHTLKD